MDQAATERIDLARAGLERLAEERGDVTADVIARYYSAMPDARASFERHAAGDMAGLEARMVAESVFLLLRWVEEPVACKIDQATTVVHHNDALEIGPRWFMGLVDAVLAVLLDTVPPEAADELALWEQLRTEIASFIDSLREEFIRTIDGEPLIGRR